MATAMRAQRGACAAQARQATVLSPCAVRGIVFQPAVSQKSTQPQRCSVRAAAAVSSRPVMAVAQLEEETDAMKLPHMYHWYETMLILKDAISDDDRDKELAKFEAFLSKEECMHVNALVRGRSAMAYPIKGRLYGLYVLYTYAAKRKTAKTIQLLLSKPDVGSEDNVMRHITFCKR